MKESRACTGMLSYENLKNCKQQMHHMHHSSRACGIVFFLQTSLPLSRNMNGKVAVKLNYIFSKISKFGYW